MPVPSHIGRGLRCAPGDFKNAVKWQQKSLELSSEAEKKTWSFLLDRYKSGMSWKFIDSGWSVKTIQREILLSHAYQLSAADSAADEEIDPDNAFVWRHSRTRLDAEEIRDSLLADAQLLDRSPAPMHPFPPQAEWNWEDQNHFAPDMSKYETDRRTVYMMIQRSVRLTYFTLFDGPNTNVSTEQRTSSLTPLQALYFMNGDLPKRCAASLVEHLPSAADKADIEQAFMTLYGRPPTARGNRAQHQLCAKCF